MLNYRRPKKSKADKLKDEEKEKEGIELPSDDENYDERRRKIWDYEAYAGLKRRPDAEVAELIDQSERNKLNMNHMEDDEPVESKNVETVASLMQKRIDEVRAKRKNKINEMVEIEKAEGFIIT